LKGTYSNCKEFPLPNTILRMAARSETSGSLIMADQEQSRTSRREMEPKARRDMTGKIGESADGTVLFAERGPRFRRGFLH
jgi:hypothetical protein